jgi:hypothetical protein
LNPIDIPKYKSNDQEEAMYNYVIFQTEENPNQNNGEAVGTNSISTI